MLRFLHLHAVFPNVGNGFRKFFSSSSFQIFNLFIMTPFLFLLLIPYCYCLLLLFVFLSFSLILTFTPSNNIIRIRRKCVEVNEWEKIKIRILGILSKMPRKRKNVYQKKKFFVTHFHKETFFLRLLFFYLALWH